jgi:glycosyltransferase involved in cell wall biosynthesis
VARYLGNILGAMVSIDPANDYLLYLDEAGGGDDVDLPEGVGKRPVGGLGHSLSWRHWSLPAAMKRDGVDVHYSPSYFVPLRRVCPAVPVVHDVSFLAHPEWFSEDRRQRYAWLFWRAVRASDIVITVSMFSRAQIARYLGVDPAIVRVIYNGVDPCFKPTDGQAARAGVMRKYGLRPGFILTVGAIHTRRNILRLVEALSLCDDRDLLVVGTPAPFSEPVDFLSLARGLGMRQRVKHVEYVPEEDLVALYGSCGAFAYPSLYEGFGLPVAEAMACGAPVACSRSASLPEVAGRAAVYFDPEDVAGIASALTAATREGVAREEMRAMSIERAALFSWETAAGRTLEALREAVEV